MSSIAIVYWSGTGNTQTMAECLAEGATSAGSTVSLLTASAFNASQLAQLDYIAFGCPSMGAEELEEDEFQPMWNEVKDHLSGKKIALFGSYGWGDGEWMRNWEEECTEIGALLVAPPLICQEEPDLEVKDNCIALGKSLS